MKDEHKSRVRHLFEVEKTQPIFADDEHVRLVKMKPRLDRIEAWLQQCLFREFDLIRLGQALQAKWERVSRYAFPKRG